MARSSTKVAESSPDKEDNKASTPDDTASPHSEHPETPKAQSESQSQEQDDEKPVDDSAPHLPDEQPPPLPDEQPPLPDDQPPPSESQPPLPSEAPPTQSTDDGWQPIWDERAQAYYFYNNLTNVSQWENPRVPEATASTTEQTKPSAGGYNPAIHGDYDPNADYAQIDPGTTEVSNEAAAAVDPAEAYAATGAFNRFTGKWQNADLTPDRFNDESKSNRQMSAFFDVDTAANTHDGRSLKAERANKKISKKELQAFKDKRRERKEEKRRAWLRD